MLNHQGFKLWLFQDGLIRPGVNLGPETIPHTKSSLPLSSGLLHKRRTRSVARFLNSQSHYRKLDKFIKNQCAVDHYLYSVAITTTMVSLQILVALAVLNLSHPTIAQDNQVPLLSPPQLSEDYTCEHPSSKVHLLSKSPLVIYIENFVAQHERLHLQSLA